MTTKRQDNRVSLHVDEAPNEGATTILVRTVDTDVVVILVGIFHDLAQKHPGIQFWAGVGTRKHFRYYHINSTWQEPGEEKARALALFTPSRVLMQHLSSAVTANSVERTQTISGSHCWVYQRVSGWMCSFGIYITSI